MKRFLTIFIVCIFASASFAAPPLPRILSDEDVLTYTEIFRLQDAGKFDAAKKLEGKLSDKILMGEVLFQRYMDKGYKSTLKELNVWMSQHSRHPGADSIHALAKKRGGTALTTRPPQVPVALSARDNNATSESFTTGTYDKKINSKIATFKRSLKRGKTLNAKNILTEPAVKKALSKSDYGRLAGRLAFMYYSDAQFVQAKEWGTISAEAGSEYGLWTMGLMSYKEGYFTIATDYFARMTQLEHIGESRKAEAAFWAGRSAAEAGNDALAKKFWKAASKNSQLFYGKLSIKMLGGTPEFEFFEQKITNTDFAEIMKHSYGMRGLALMQVGQIEAAERQFRYLATAESSDKLLHAAHALGTNYELPRLQLQMGRITREKGILEISPDVISAAQYPMPNWEPLKGWSVDRALVFAIIRQESAFKTNAKSSAGAQGAMQLMPKTAKTIARQNHINLGALNMSNPEHNVYLGQTLINNLLKRPHIDNNIIKLLAAYNAGEQRMLNWQKKFNTDDPFLYIESFPAFETREYIKLVISNLWLYRARLDQPMTAITDLAEGRWPIYSSHDHIASAHENAEDDSEL
ncbi:MAG: lytic transglycosylase domain-containing protein [Rickettsiales bacterium]|jgi:soluble lytic murein transglycosylase-like protein|nr:lytic transglycosylase domain-containing protein [Rickettsiales bacterium]